jgi:hypothetical protein
MKKERLLILTIVFSVFLCVWQINLVSGQETCIEFEKTGPETALPGETITYTFKVYNCSEEYPLRSGFQVYDPLFDPELIRSENLEPLHVDEFYMDYTLLNDSCGDFTNEACAEGHARLPDGTYLEYVEVCSSWTVDVICDVDCPCGYYCPGDDNKTACPSGMYSLDNATECEWCPEGQMPTPDNCSCTDIPSAITLAAFDAKPGNGQVTLLWETGSEEDNFAFNIYRAEAEDGEYEMINADMIPSEGSLYETASYEFVDDDVQNRKTYYYKLEDIDINGMSTVHGPVKAVPRLIYGILGR